MIHTTYIGIGSNLGNRRENCLSAVEHISKLPGTKVITVSKWRETPAMTPSRNEKQPNYINGAVKIGTALSPEELLSKLQEIEVLMGRETPHKKWSPRTIDLDILFYDDIVIRRPGIELPHPELHKRIFVLEPLCDIEPALMHPALGRTVSELLSEEPLSHTGCVKTVVRKWGRRCACFY